MKWAYFLVWVVCHLCATESLVLTASQNKSTVLLDRKSNSRVRPGYKHPSQSTPTVLFSTSEGTVLDSSEGNMKAAKIPKIFFILNASTKWLVSVAVTVGVFWNPKKFQGPYIVVGSIASSFLADFLKQKINQGRPDGAPFVDPGMPSSHAMVSFFMASAWQQVLGASSGIGLFGASSIVSLLRVICGYHTVPQIGVGAVLGSVLGASWMQLGAVAQKQNPQTMWTMAWASYLLGSAIFIKKKIGKWLGEEKAL